MLIVPDSSVSLYADVPISDGHEIVFRSKTEQSTYFATKKIASKAGCTYLKKTGRLRIEWSTATVMRADFISFKNPSFENITFYAKLIDYEYVNNVTTDVLYEIDWFQSFCFDVEMHPCGIVREQLTEEDYQKAVANPWRRDIPELLTDEDLPVSESLECIYTNGVNTMGTVTGNRFPLTSGIPLIDQGLKQLQIVMYLSSIRNSEDLDDSQKTQFRNFLSFWSTLNGNTFDYQTVNIDNIFATTNERFCRSYAVLTMPLSEYENFSKAVSYLSALSITGNIVGLYILPSWMASGGSFTTGFKIPKLQVNNPKLNTFPFRYLRMKTPQDVKEYRIDLFDVLQHSEDAEVWLNWKLTSNVSGAPIMALLPQGYKNSGDEYNFYERIEYSNFPQMAFSTDAYLAYISSQNQLNLLSYTTPVGQATLANKAQNVNKTFYNEMGNMINSVLNTLSTLPTGDAKGAVTNAASTMGDMAGFGMQTRMSTAESKQANIENIATQYMGSSYSYIYDNAKKAFIANDYKPGGAAGYLAYEEDKLDIICEIVELNSDILDKYDDFFSCYGYNSSRYGLPHVYSYMKDGTQAPHFSSVKNDNEKFTFVKTENAHVTGALQVACRSIENLFNNGCRFLKVVE